MIGGGGRVGFGNLTNTGSPITVAGSDNFGPAWSSPRRNAYLNPAPGTEYLAFARGSSAAAPHDIYYLAVLQNIDAGGESGRSNEMATTPLTASTPVYQVNAGGREVTDANFPGQDYKPDNYTETSGINSIVPVQVTGGQADPINVAQVNTLNDPNTPPAVYQTDRSGTFTYTFKYLTHSPTGLNDAKTRYRVRLHLSDPKDNTIGKRQFNISLNGTPQFVTVPSPTTGLPTATQVIDIVQLAQASPGKLNGLVSDATTQVPIAGATLTVTDYATGATVTTNPSPITTTAATSAPPSGSGSPINYAGTLPKGTYVVTVTPPAGSGYSPESQVVNVNSGFFARADFTLSTGTATINGTVTDTGGKVPISGAVITLTDTVTGATVATTPASVVSAADGTFTETAPPGSYYITATPPAGSGYAVQTHTITPVDGGVLTQTFTLATGAAVGVVGGLVTDSVSTLPIPGALVKLLDANGNVAALTRTTAATTSPVAPVGDGNPVNYTLLVPVGAGSLQFSASGYGTLSQSVTVVNTPASGTTAATEFVRADKALVNSTPNTGQNTAVVLEFSSTAPDGTIAVAFTPVAGDPPIVQALELISDSNGATSSGFGDARGTAATSAPTIISTLGGVVAAAAQVTITFENSTGTGTPSSYNIYRTTGTPTTENNPPVVSPAGTEGNTPYLGNLSIGTTPGVNIIDVGLDRATGLEKFSFTDTGATLGSEYYYEVTATYQQVVTPETPVTDANGNAGLNPAIQLNTDDNPGQTSTAGNVYDDIYPTWSPFVSVFSIAYSSNRTVTYNNPAASNAPAETAISIARGGSLSGTTVVGANYAGILESQVLNLDPPTLLPYSGNEIVHVTDSGGNTTRYGIQPGQPVTFTVRLSDREAGIDNGDPTATATDGSAGGADPTKPQVFIQIKDPDSKYQDAQQMEHKVFAKDYDYRSQVNNPNGFFFDSGTSSLLMNGGSSSGVGINYEGFNQFTLTNGFVYRPSQRGSIGGIDGPEAFGQGIGPGAAGNKSDTISVGQSGGGTNSGIIQDIKGNPVLDPNKNPYTQLPGSDPSRFIPWGPEYECEFVNPQFATSGGSKYQAGDTAVGDYGAPYYLAGVDDQQPFSGAGKQRPTTNPLGGGPAEWLQLTRVPDAQQDGQGGVLYNVTWTTPTSGSDFYLDVIAFDKAAPPPVTSQGTSIFGQGNWRIYDNVWGFSTASSLNNNDILVVSDYALGQKFAATTFGGQRGLLNLVPKLYGTESYVTDIDVSLLPNAIYRYAVFPGASIDNPESEVLDLGAYNAPDSQVISGSALEDFYLDPATDEQYTVINGLGVDSYFDRFISDGGKVDGFPSVRSQQYSLWRILSRGPVPDAVLRAYEPSVVTQPAVNDPGSPAKINVAAAKVPVANRCILWLAPYTGDVLSGAGTLIDPATQTSLKSFVAAGGRLCVSGQDVGSALTQGGTVNNNAAGFLSTVLGATLATPSGGTHIPVPTGTTNADNRISNTPYFDGQVQGNYPELTPGNTTATVAPGQRLIRVSNNYDGNVFESVYPRTAAYAGNWRTDGALDQLGPYIQAFPPGVTNETNDVVGQIDTITPNAGAHIDLTLAAFQNPIPPVDNGDDNAASGPGGAGLIYTENPITATGGTGSKVIYSTFGLEGLSTEYYKQTLAFKPNAYVYLPRNQRQNILHNIVNYLRTGSISGTVRATTGNGVVGSGVPGVTVYLLSAFGPAIPGRGTFSAVTDAAGNFHIDGIEPGDYTLAAYRTGFTRTTSDPGVVFTIEGDATQQASLTISQATGGSINGVVTDGVNPVPGANVTFTATDGTTQQTTTDANGTYNLPGVPAGTYSGFASKTPGYTNSASQSVTVTGNSISTVNFVLKPGPGAVSGRVISAATGLPISGAKVYFLAGSPAALVTTATTDATGTYTTTVQAGSYTLTATAAGYGESSPVAITVAGGQTVNPPDISLGLAVSGTLGGLVTASSSTLPLAGVTLTIVDAGTLQPVSPSVVTSGTAATAADGGQINYGPVTLPVGTYTVTATKNGVTAGTQTVTISSGSFTRLDFTGVVGLPAVHTFSAGLNFLSLPYSYAGATFDSLFGTLNTAPSGTTANGTRSHVAVWDPLQNVYALDPNAPADAIRLGVGYWIYLKQPVGINQTGATPAGTVTVALNPAWNQIGVPSINGVLVSSLTFDMGNGSAPLTFAAAASSANHVVSPVLYRFDGSAYQPIAATDTLQPWTAYWIRVYTPTTLRIPTGH